MDVNLTISLMRGQMGAVIENAVNVAVETVLGEMLRVVGIKFEEFKREMNLKEKENENMRKMLEASRCQSKTMRKYIGLLSSKDPDRMCRDDGMPSAASQCRKGPVCPKALNPRARTSEAPLWVRQQMPTTKAPAVNHEQMRSESLGSEHKGNSSGQLVDSLLSETSDPVWGQNPQTSAETEHTDVADTGVPSTTNITEEPSQTTSTMTPSLKIKKEEAEVEIVCVTDEHSEAANLPRLEFPNHDLHHQGGEPDLGVPLDLPGSFHSLQNPNTTADFTIPHFIGVDPSTYDDNQLSVAGVQKQVRPRRKDLNLYEEFKRSRTQMRGRNTNRRRELEQTLPHALLADLVRERREKTRLRVARWRAKRKLQACLMASQAAQFNGGPVQGTPAQRGGLISVQRRGGATGQRGGHALRREISDTKTYNLLLQVGPSSSQSLGFSEDRMLPGSAALCQHQNPKPGSTYQY